MASLLADRGVHMHKKAWERQDFRLILLLILPPPRRPGQKWQKVNIRG